MVEIVTGNGLGLQQSSARTLGQAGVSGTALLGRQGEEVYLNAATGNLYIQHQDELLKSTGLDLSLLRTYNSLGALTDDNGDNWKIGVYRKVYALTGTVNTANSTVKRVGADGSEVTYTYDSGSATYRTDARDGVFDTLVYASVPNTWTWTNGTTRLIETYDNANGGRITKSQDPDGKTLTYNYTGTLLTSVVDSTGDTTYLDYSGTNLTQLRSVASGGATSIRTRYGYDSSNRLVQVIVDLSPDDASIADGRTFVTRYTYDGTSKRVASVTQGDGTTLSILYDASGRVQKLTDGVSRQTQFAYDTVNRKTTVTDAALKTTVYAYDTFNRLTSITAPAVGGASTVVQFGYDGNGRLGTVTDGRGLVTTYQYDVNGNRTSEMDAAGNTVTRTFGAKNEILTETRYVTPDPDLGGTGVPSNPLTTRYAYDPANHQRFMVSADGLVTEYRYNGAGQQVARLQYAGNRYDVSALTVTQTLSETTLANWVALAGVDKTKLLRTDTGYDLRGQVSTVTAYAATDATGAGLAAGKSVTTYVYSAGGDLLQVIDANTKSTSYVYDGLHRQTGVLDATGRSTLVQYDDANNRVMTLLADGSVTTAVYDAAGERVSLVEGQSSSVWWSQDFASGTSGLVLSAGGQITYDSANQRLKFTTANVATTTIPLAVGTATYRFESGPKLRAEVTTGATSAGRFFGVGFDSGGTTPSRAHFAVFAEDGLYAQYSDGTNYPTVALSTPSTLIKNNTTYVVELESDTTGTTLYVYEKGKDRSSGYVDRRGYADWGAVRVLAETAGSAGRAVTETALDNVTVTAAPRAAGAVLWRQDFEVNAAGVGALPASQVSLGGGRLTFTSAGSLAAATTPAISGPALYGFSQGTGFRAEVTTGPSTSAAGREFAVGADNASATSPRCLRAYFVGSSLYASYYNPATSSYASTLLSSTVKNDTTYVVEVETNVSGVDLYVYEKALARPASASYHLAQSDWGGAHLSAYTTGLTTARVAAPMYLESVTEYVGPGAAAASTGVTTRYFYDALGHLRMTQDPSGVRTHYLYDAAGRQVGLVDGSGSLTEYVYNRDDQLTKTVTYATAVSTASLVDANGNPLSVDIATLRPTTNADDRSSVRVYDSAGRLTRTVDARRYVVDYVYDGLSRLVTTTAWATALTATPTLDANNNVTTGTPVADAANDRVTRSFYDGDGRLLASLDAEGYLVTYTYDGAGQQVTRYAYATLTNASYRASGTLTQLLTTAVDAARDQKTTTLYDGQGRTVGVVDAEGYLTETTYDAAGNRLTVTRYATKALAGSGPLVASYRPATNAEDHTTQYSYTVLNQVASTTGPDGTVTQLAYDGRGRVLTETAAAGTADTRTVTRRYDLLGRVIGELSGEGSAALAALGASATSAQIEAVWSGVGTTYGYDAAGRKVSEIDANAHRTLYYYDADGRLTLSIDALGEVTETRYTALNQVLQTRRYANRLTAADLTGLTGGAVPASLTTRLGTLADAARDELTGYTYNLTGQVATTSDPLSQVVTRSYNAFGELATRSSPLDATHTLQVDTRYDRRGLLASTTADATGINAQVATLYDAFGRAYQQTDANGNVRTTGYDRLGRVVSQGDGLGLAAVTTFDAFERVQTVTDRLGNVTTTSYNTASRSMTVTTPEGVAVTTVLTRRGQTLSVTQNGATTSYGYDKDGHLKSTTDALAHQTLRGYDHAGLLTTTTDANGIVTAYAYDAVNRVFTRTLDPTSVNPAGLNLVTTYSYDSSGRTLTVQDPGGLVTKTVYDRAGQTTDVIVDPTGLALTTHYTYDKSGHTLTVTTGYGTADARVVQYGYDLLGRRTSERVDPAGLNLTTGYGFDKNGNVTTKTDPNGNVTRYYYDANDRLVYTLDPALGLVEQRYDAEGRVTKRIAYATLATGMSATPTKAEVQAKATAITDATKDRVTQHVYDRDGREVFGLTTVDGVAGKAAVVERVYDGSNQVVKAVAYLNTISTATAATVSAVRAALVLDSANDRTTRTVYDAVGEVRYTIDALGYVVERVYDAAGQRVKQVAYATAVALSGLPTEAAVAAALTADATKDRVTRYAYDSAGRQVYALDAAGYLVKTSYDASSRLIGTLAFAKAITVSGTPGVAALAALEASASVSGQDRMSQLTLDNAGRVTAEARGTRTGVAFTALATTTFGYDAAGNQTKIIDARGAELADTDSTWAVAERQRLGYQTTVNNVLRGKYVSELTSAERDALRLRYTATQEFDKANRKTAYVDPLGGRTETQYDAAGNIVKATDPNGNAGYFYYDALGHETLRVDPLGYVTASVRNAFGEVTDTTRYAAVVVGAASVANKPQVFSAAPGTSPPAYLVSSLALDEHSVTAYDVRGLKTTFSDALGHTETTHYNAFGEQDSFTDKNGNQFTYKVDQRGQRTSETSPFVNVIKTADMGTLTPTSTQIITTYEYNAFGEQTKKIAASNLADQSATTLYDYDVLGRQVTVTLPPVSVWNATTSTASTVSPVTSRAYDAVGNATTETDANGNVTTHFFDALNREVLTVDAAGAVKTATYDAAGNRIVARAYETLVTGAVTPAVPPVPTGTYRELTYRYDANNLEVARVDSAVDSDNGYYNASANPKFTTTAATALRFYDRDGNLVKEVDGRGNATWHLRDAAGHEVAKVDALGYLTAYSYDAFGNRTKATQFATQGVDPKTAWGQLSSLNVAVEGQRIATADAVQIPAAVGVLLGVLNQDGTSKDQNNDRTTVYTFDKLNRVVKEEVLNASFNELDAAGNRLPTKKAAASAPSVIREHVYDNLGHETRLREYGAVNGVLVGEQRDTDAAFDALGRQVQQTAPASTVVTNNTTGTTASAGAVTTLRYDAVGRKVAEIKEAYVSGVAGTGTIGAAETVDEVMKTYYDAAGRVIKTVDASGKATTYQYDAAGNVLLQQRSRSRYVGDTTPATDKTIFTYDKLNRQLTQADSGTNVVKGRQYNAFGDVVREGEWDAGLKNGVYQKQYAYDRLGRLVYSNAESGTARLYAYDEAGNVTMEAVSDGATSLSQTSGLLSSLQLLSEAGNVNCSLSTYDARNQLLSVKRPDFTNIQNVAGTVSQAGQKFTVGGLTATQYATMSFNFQESVNTLVSAPTVLVFQDDITAFTASWDDPLAQNINRYQVVSNIWADGTPSGGLWRSATVSNTQVVANNVASYSFVPPSKKNWDASPSSLLPAPWVQSTSSASWAPAHFSLAFYQETGPNTNSWVQLGSYSGTGSSLGADLTATGWHMNDVLNTSGTVILTEPALNFVNQTADSTRLDLTIDGTAYSVSKTGTGAFTLNLSRTAGQGTYIAPGVHRYEYKAFNGSNVLTNRASGLISLSADFKTITTTHANESPDYTLELVTSQTPITYHLQRQQAYNAFGEVISETDGNGNVTNLAYNALGKLVQKMDPQVMVWDADKNAVGVEGLTNPTTKYFFNAFGESVGTQNARGFESGAVIENGHVITQVFANGTRRDSGFDIFGNLVRQNQQHAVSGETLYWTRYSYDLNNQLVRLDRPSGGWETYAYDEAGNRIARTFLLGRIDGEAQDTGLTGTESYLYDSAGRVTQYTSPFGRVTTYSYTWVADLAADLTSPLASNVSEVDSVRFIPQNLSGYKTVTTRWDTKKLEDRKDVFGTIQYHKDLGDHEFYYHYDQAGRLLQQRGSSGQDIRYNYYANDYVHQVSDRGVNRLTTYEYDANGNRTLEAISDITTTAMVTKHEYYQVTKSTYDALNRITHIADPRYTIDYKYDANGNRVEVNAKYDYFLNTWIASEQGLSQTQDYWYAYDKLDRFTTTMGTLSGGVVVRGLTGYDITYNSDGGRMSSRRTYGGNDPYFANKEVVENYAYNYDGYLSVTTALAKDVGASDAALAQTNSVLRILNYAGQTVRSDEYGAAVNNGAGIPAIGQVYRRYNLDGDVLHERELRTDTLGLRDAAATDYSYIVGALNVPELQSRTRYDYRKSNGQYGSPTDVTTTTRTQTDFAYSYWDSAKQFTLTVKQSLNSSILPTTQTGRTDLTYDFNGHLTKSSDTVGNKYLEYAVDQDGRILTRRVFATSASTTPSSSHNYYYFNGVTVGDLGDDNASIQSYAEALAAAGKPSAAAGAKPVTSADFDQNYEPISQDYPGPTSTRYTVQVNGESLASIALTIWGDASLWYLIADANGLNGTEVLKAGTALTIPNKVTNVHNAFNTFTPYEAGAAVGDISPTLPEPPPLPLYQSVTTRQQLKSNIRVLKQLKAENLLGADGEKSLREMQKAWDNGFGVVKKKKGGCGGFFSFLMTVATVVVAVYAAGLAAAAMMPETAVAGSASTWGLGGLAMTGGGTAAGITAGTVGMTLPIAMTSAAVGAAAGSFAGQLIGVATGQLDGFSFGDIAFSAVTAGVGSGIAGAAGRLLHGPMTMERAVLQGAAGNAGGQMVANAFGKQSGFDWQGLAAAMGSAAINYRMGADHRFGKSGYFDKPTAVQYLTRELVQGAVSGAVGLLFDSGHGLDWGAIAGDAVGRTIVAYGSDGLSKAPERGLLNPRNVASVIGFQTLADLARSDYVTRKPGDWNPELRPGDSMIPKTARSMVEEGADIAGGTSLVAKMFEFVGLADSSTDSYRTFSLPVGIEATPDGQKLAGMLDENQQLRAGVTLKSFAEQAAKCELPLAAHFNGIRNSYWQAIGQGTIWATEQNVVAVNVYNPTSNAFLDSFETGLQVMFGLNNASVAAGELVVKDLVNLNEANFPSNPYTFVDAHSQGTAISNIVVSQLPEEIQKKIDLRNVGTVSGIVPRFAHSYYGVQNVLDSTPQLVGNIAGGLGIESSANYQAAVGEGREYHVVYTSFDVDNNIYNHSINYYLTDPIARLSLGLSILPPASIANALRSRGPWVEVK